MAFWNKKNESGSRDKDVLNSTEYESCVKKLIELSSRISELETSNKLLETDIANLRGKFNQRLKGLKDEETKEEKKTETINNSEYIAFG